MSLRSETELFNIILSPHVSEKASRVAGDRQYVFKIRKGADKLTVKKAIEAMFKVKVEKVHVCNMPGKKKNFGRILGRRPGWKKAYVTLVEGNSIELESAA